jgi:RHS repeat-associated protein
MGTTSYDAWGNPATGGGLTSITPFGFAGGYTDPTGLIYLMQRYYDPGTGQFKSVDPAVDSTGTPYSYAYGNPVSNIDPTGAFSWHTVYSGGFTWANFTIPVCGSSHGINVCENVNIPTGEAWLSANLKNDDKYNKQVDAWWVQGAWNTARCLSVPNMQFQFRFPGGQIVWTINSPLIQNGCVYSNTTSQRCLAYHCRYVVRFPQDSTVTGRLWAEDSQAVRYNVNNDAGTWPFITLLRN